MPDDEKYSYYFYDINAKINHKFSDRSRLYLSAYNGKDHFAADYDSNTDYKDGSKMNWGNTIISARWNYIFNNRLFSNTTVSYNNYYSTLTHIRAINMLSAMTKPLPTGILPITAPALTTGTIR